MLKELVSDKQNKIIVFVETKKKVDDVTKVIKSNGFSAISIHGDKSQPERDYVLAEFRTGKSLILVATDVAARGLDVEDVRCVINFDYPNSSEDYVHRIGRTGRCQQIGTSYAFFTPNNQRQARDLVAVLEEASQDVCPQLMELAETSRGAQNGRNRWKSNRNKDSSSPNSQNSNGGKNKMWMNNKNFTINEFRPSNSMRTNGMGSRVDGSQTLMRNNNGNGGYSYGNSQQYQNVGQRFQQSYNPNAYQQQQQQVQFGGQPSRGFSKYFDHLEIVNVKFI